MPEPACRWPLENKAPMLQGHAAFSRGWHAGDSGACFWAVHGAPELRVLTVVALCAAA